MMRTSEERGAAVKRRIAEINLQKQRRTIFLAVGAALAAAAIAAPISGQIQGGTVICENDF